LSELGKPARLLLVEDEWVIAFRLEEAVRDMGYDPVGPVPTVRQALALLENQLVDGAVLDVSLGSGEKSFPIAIVLRDRNIPFLFVSGYQERDLPAEFAGIPICAKPYTDDALREKLRTLVGSIAPNGLSA
jgi:DNA-binding response OmpR family regulator